MMMGRSPLTGDQNEFSANLYLYRYGESIVHTGVFLWRNRSAGDAARIRESTLPQLQTMKKLLREIGIVLVVALVLFSAAVVLFFAEGGQIAGINEEQTNPGNPLYQDIGGYVFEPVEEERETFDEILDSIDEELEQRKEDEVLEDPVIESVEPEEIEETREDNEMNTLVEESITNEEKAIGEEEQTAILETVNPAEETFVTYHIHVMTETDTIESVCIKYNTTQNLLGEYNDLSTVAIGDKIIIPDINE